MSKGAFQPEMYYVALIAMSALYIHHIIFNCSYRLGLVKGAQQSYVFYTRIFISVQFRKQKITQKTVCIGLAFGFNYERIYNKNISLSAVLYP